MKNENKNVKKSIGSWFTAILLAALIFAVAVPINLIASRVDVNVDMTPNQLFDLSTETKTLLENLEKDVTIYLLFDLEQLPDDDTAPREEMALYRLINNYKDYDRVTVVVADPETAEGLETIRNLDLPESFIFVKGDCLVVCDKAVKRVIGTTMFAEGTTTVYFNAENVISSAIKYVTNENIPMVYFTQGHGEKNYEDYYSKLADNLIKNNYNSKPLDLTSEEEIPADAGLVVIISPTEDFTKADKEKFDKYFDGGGKVVFMLDPNDSSTIFPNIEDILEEYSLAMNYDKVVETDVNQIVQSEGGGVEAYIVNLVSPTIDEKTGEIAGTVDFTSALIESSKNDADMEEVYTFMPPSRSFSAVITSKYYQLELGTLIGTNETALSEPFGGNKIDVSEKTGSALLSVYSIDANRKGSALFVFGADVVSNERTESLYFTNPLYVFLTILSWACENDSNVGVPQKMVTYDLMTFAEQKEADKIIALMWAYPILIAALGVIAVWVRRTN
ncbi:MAG: GldG family protein [Ruminococcus sp.]|jgi:hypothetical protein|nr:GldG family protein [Ruminococcus sp.]